MQQARLGLVVDSSGVRTARGEVRALGGDMARAERGVGSAADGMAASLRRAAGGFLAAAGAGATLTRAFGAAQEYTQITNRLRALGASSEEAGERIAEIADIANRTRAPLGSVAQLYTRLQLSADSLGASQDQLAQFTETIGLALAASGTSAGEAQGALMQLSQAMAGGVVRAEEFNSIMEGAPGIMLAAAKGLEGIDGDIGKLRAAMLDGRITSEAFFNAILSQSDALRASFNATELTIGQALTGLRNNLILTVGAFDRLSGASGGIARTIEAIGDNLARLGAYAATAAAIIGGRYVAALVSARVATLGLAGSMIALRTAIIRTGFGALVVGAGEAVFQFGRLVQATGSIGEALAALGRLGPEVMDRIQLGAQAAVTAMGGLWARMRYEFLSALGAMGVAASDFFAGLAERTRGFPGMDAISGQFDRLATVSIQAAAGLNEAQGAALGASVTAKQQAAELANAATAPLQGLAELREIAVEAGDGMGAAAGSAGTLGGALGDGGSGGKKGLSKAAKDAARELEKLRDEAEAWKERVATPVEKYRTEIAKLDAHLAANRLGPETYRRALEELNTELGDGLPLVGDLSSAFGDFVSSGLRDFEGFASNIAQGFKRLISDMVATAARNRILIGLGIAAPGTAMAGAGGLGGFGGLGSIFAGGAGGLFSALGSGGLGGAASYLGGALKTATSGMAGFANALGAVAPVVGLVGLAFSAFRKRTTELDAGLRVTTRGMDTLVETFRKTESSRFFGLIKSRDTDTDPASAAVAGPLQAAVRGIQRGVTDAAEALGVGSRAFNGFAYELSISTKDMSQDEALREVQSRLGEVGDAFAGMVPGLSRFQAEGESLVDTLGRLAGNLQGVNHTLRGLGFDALDRSLEGASRASWLASLAGGVEGFAQAGEFFFDNFYTLNQRVEILSKRFRSSVRDLTTYSIPETEKEFRRLVKRFQSDDRMGDATQLMTLAPLFVELRRLQGEMDKTGESAGRSADKVGEARERVAEAEREARAVRSALEARIREETADTTARLNVRLREAQSAAQRARSAFDLLDTAASQASPMSRSAALRALERGGRSPDLTDAIAALREDRSDRFGTAFAAARDQARAAAALETARDRAKAQLSEAERAASGIERRIRQAERQSERELAKLDRLAKGLDAVGVEVASVGKGFRMIERALATLDKAERAERRASQSVRGFARGGDHVGGLRLVGERGPELEFTGPSRVQSAHETGRTLGDDDTVAELRLLRRQVGEQAALLAEIARSTRGSDDRLRQWDNDGQPVVRA